MRYDINVIDVNKTAKVTDAGFATLNETIPVNECTRNDFERVGKVDLYDETFT